VSILIKNYFFLSRVGKELNNLLNNYVILDCFTAQKEKLTLNISNENNFHLEICVNHSLPYILLRENSLKKRKNKRIIFEDIINLKLLNVFIARNDRVLLFQIENSISFFFAIRGKYTNVYLLNNKCFSSFKKIDENELIKIKENLLSLEYVYPGTEPEFENEDKKLTFKELNIKYPFITSEVLENFNNEKDYTFSELKQGINKILQNNLYLINDYNQKTSIISLSKTSENDLIKAESFHSALDISLEFIRMKIYFDEYKKLYNEINRYIDKEIKNLNNRKENILSRISAGSKEEEFRKIAELLLININKLKKGLGEVTLENVFNENELIKITLNKKLTPQKNIDNYFKKSREEKFFFQRSGEILNKTEKRLELLNALKVELNNSETIEQLKSIMKKIGLKMKEEIKKSNEVKIKFKHFIIENKYNVYVGRDNISNDILTLKFAKPDDYWFHASSVSGSHVVLHRNHKNEIIPKSIIKKTASIAAYFSKAKNSSLAPVSYTLKKYVIKRKGMNPGQVALLREETILVKPEIPIDVVIKNNETKD